MFAVFILAMLTFLAGRLFWGSEEALGVNLQARFGRLAALLSLGVTIMALIHMPLSWRRVRRLKRIVIAQGFVGALGGLGVFAWYVLVYTELFHR